MTKFQMTASVWGGEFYQAWENNETSLSEVLCYALAEGVDISGNQLDEVLLDGVMGIVGGYILTYEADEDIINVWKQITC